MLLAEIFNLSELFVAKMESWYLLHKNIVKIKWGHIVKKQNSISGKQDSGKSAWVLELDRHKFTLDQWETGLLLVTMWLGSISCYGWNKFPFPLMLYLAMGIALTNGVLVEVSSLWEVACVPTLSLMLLRWHEESMSKLICCFKKDEEACRVNLTQTANQSQVDDPQFLFRPVNNKWVLVVIG